jgi:DNA-binding GntR family transcriptional regulator
VSLAEAVEITEVRMALEGLCAAKAAERLTDADRDRLHEIGDAMRAAVASGDLLGYSELNRRLHGLVLSLAGQTTAAAILERLRGQSVRHQFRLALHPGRPAISLPQHLEIIEALCAGDADGAEAAMRRHIRSVIDTLPEVDTSGARRFDAL